MKDQKENEIVIGEFEFGPRARMEGESFEKYKERRQLENKVLEARMKHGIANWDSASKGTYRDTEKREAKRLRKETALRK